MSSDFHNTMMTIVYSKNHFNKNTCKNKLKALYLHSVDIYKPQKANAYETIKTKSHKG